MAATDADIVTTDRRLHRAIGGRHHHRLRRRDLRQQGDAVQGDQAGGLAPRHGRERLNGPARYSKFIIEDRIAGAVMQTFGTYDVDQHGRRCYRPPVPPFPRLDDLWDRLDPALRAISDFDRVLGSFPLANVIGKLFARLDAVHSSGAEGTTTTFTDLMGFQSGLKQARDREDAQTVAGCADAFDALSSSPQPPGEMVRLIHRRLFERAKDPYVVATAGHWKTIPNSTFDSAQGGPFHFTAPDALGAALDEWEMFTLADGAQPELVRQCLSHWMFEHIHPVADGNGRVGRLLLPLMLRQKQATAQACAFMGEGVHLNKSLYVDALRDGRITGDLTAFVRTCLSLIRQTARANHQRLDAVGGLYRTWQDVTAKYRRQSVIHKLVPFALTTPVFTVRDAQRALAAAPVFQTVNAGIAELVELGVLRQRSSEGQIAARDRLFEVPAVIELFDPVRA